MTNFGRSNAAVTQQQLIWMSIFIYIQSNPKRCKCSLFNKTRVGKMGVLDSTNSICPLFWIWYMYQYAQTINYWRVLSQCQWLQFIKEILYTAPFVIVGALIDFTVFL